MAIISFIKAPLSIGFGFNPITNKKNAIDPYLYSIAIENSSYRHYWTEKISDVFLGYSAPIYYGCKNLDEYSLETVKMFYEDAKKASDEGTSNARKQDAKVNKDRDSLDALEKKMMERHLDCVSSAAEAVSTP